jgi:hypothetical protein
MLFLQVVWMQVRLAICTLTLNFCNVSWFLNYPLRLRHYNGAVSVKPLDLQTLGLSVRGGGGINPAVNAQKLLQERETQICPRKIPVAEGNSRQWNFVKLRREVRK